MKVLTIVFVIAVGVAYVFLSAAMPDEKLFLRIGAMALIAIFVVITNIVRGRPALTAAENPLAAEPVPSLNLSARSLDQPADKK